MFKQCSIPLRRNPCCICIAVQFILMNLKSHAELCTMFPRCKNEQYPLYFPISYLHFGLNNTDFSLHLFMPSNQLFHTFHIFPKIQCLYQYTLEGAVGCANGEDDKKQKDHNLIFSNSLLLHFFVLPCECSYCLFKKSMGHLVCTPYRDGTRIYNSLNSRYPT